MSNDHDHPHDHAPDADEHLSYYQAMEVAVRELLIEKGVLSADEVRRQIEDMDARTPARGAQVVARAWVEPAYKARLLANGSAACEEIGLDVGPMKLVVVENTPDIHNLIVCTLCSCYPRPLLGLPPDWYKDLEYRARIVRQSRTVLREMGLDLPPEVEVRVWDTTADTRYIVIPQQPPHTLGWPEERLAEVVTRDSMIGVSRL